jgi:prepilin-type processing-associated H-X9-DG protein
MFHCRFTIPDALVTAFLSLVLIFFAIAARTNLDSADARVKCASHLRQIGQAILLYCNDSRGAYPRTMYDPITADRPTAYTGVESNDPFKAGGPAANDVSAAYYNLLRTEDITAAVFICPATGNFPDVYGGGIHTALDQANFPSAKNLDYSFANPYPDADARSHKYKLVMGGVDPTFVIAADMNPGVVALTQITVQSPQAQIRPCNSANHCNDGQNCLYADGHVEFQNNPFCGVRRDNIYTFGDSGYSEANAAYPTGGEGIWGSPATEADSILLPAAIMPAAAPIQASAMTSPPAPAPITVDPGADISTFVFAASLAVLLILLLVVVILVLKRRQTAIAKDE